VHAANELLLVVWVIFFPPHGLASHLAVPKRRFSAKQACGAPIFAVAGPFGTGLEQQTKPRPRTPDAGAGWTRAI